MTDADSITPAPNVATLAELTTFHLGGTPARYVAPTSAEEIIEAVRVADDAGEQVLILGGGSNLLIAGGELAFTVIHVGSRGVEVASADACSGVTIDVAAGEPWDDLVALAVGKGWSGIEALSGIPGSVGATPVQNVGAYGQEVAHTIATVRTWDRAEQRVRTFANADAEFAYRDSIFKRERFRGGPRYVVLQVRFQLAIEDHSAPVRYAELARTLGVDLGERAPLGAVRETVLGLRRGKGMVADVGDHDSWSAGSFFTNPIVPATVAATLPAGAPRWPMESAGSGRDPLVKLSAGWLIEHAGFGKGFGLPGPASLSTKHTLALTNRGTATTDDVLTLARQVRDGVREVFGVTLVPEPVLVGCSI